MDQASKHISTGDELPLSSEESLKGSAEGMRIRKGLALEGSVVTDATRSSREGALFPDAPS